MLGAPRLLYTIGYSGHSVESFVRVLQAYTVSVLLDVRMNPVSRKKGFSKRTLSKALEDAGISYVHMATLGSPPALRHSLASDGDFDAFFTGFRAYLALQESTVRQACYLVLSRQACLMCVEKEPNECHRSALAEAIVATAEREVIVQHLTAE